MSNIERFSSNIYNRASATESHLKVHTTVMHSGCPKHSHQHELEQKPEKQNFPYCDHLFCFFCERFLRTQTDVIRHQCEPTRLLSRKWHSEATWIRNKCKCNICSDEIFQCKVCLEKHMCEHMYNSQERLSELFQFVPSFSNQTERVEGLGMAQHDSCSDTYQDDTEESQQPMLYLCDVCNQTCTTMRHLKGHKTRMHSGKSTNSQREARQKCPYSEHLYCFYCKQFLKSLDEISCHKCKTTRLLSRYWYNKAVWAKNEYECTFCTDKFVSSKFALEKHMLTHEKKTSQLFKCVPISSNQTARMANLGKTCLQKDALVDRNKYHSHVLNRHNAVMSLQEQSTRTKVQPVEDQDLTDDINSDMSCHDDNFGVALDTANEDSSVEVRVTEETRPSYIPVEPNQNTPEPAEINKQSIQFDCDNCGCVFSLPDLFIAHVMMYPNCLMFYEKLESEPPALVPFCFKCKKAIQTETNHRCIGVVSIMYKCALCPNMFSNTYSLLEHENERHTVTIKHEHLETIQTINDNKLFVNVSAVYR